MLPASRAQEAAAGEEVEKRARKVSGEIAEYLRETGSSRVTVIIQVNGQASQPLVTYLTRAGAGLKGQYTLLGDYAVEARAALVPGLANFPEVKAVSILVSSGALMSDVYTQGVRALARGDDTASLAVVKDTTATTTKRK